MNTSSKHMEKVIAALVVVIIALLAVVMKLESGNQGQQSAATQSGPVMTAPPARRTSKPLTTPAPAAVKPPVVTPPALVPPVVSTEGKTQTQLRLARNEIYARHGYRFHDTVLAAYFGAKPWYHPDTSDMQEAEKRFTPAETADVASLVLSERATLPITNNPPSDPQLAGDESRPADDGSPLVTDTASSNASAHSDNSVQVWVNTNTGVYHYPGERWYGNTKEGEYMSEDDAKAAGYRPTENGQ